MTNAAKRRRRRKSLAARKNGEQAAVSGNSIEANPYQKDDWRHAQWLFGYGHGKASA
jgi:ribosome modulation factor